jgi:hypothetical protein
MHGGAAGSGAPKGKRNGKYRHGSFTTEAIDERRRLASLIRDSRDFLSRLPKRTYTLKTRSPADELKEDAASATTDADALLRFLGPAPA